MSPSFPPWAISSHRVLCSPSQRIRRDNRSEAMRSGVPAAHEAEVPDADVDAAAADDDDQVAHARAAGDELPDRDRLPRPPALHPLARLREQFHELRRDRHPLALLARLDLAAGHHAALDHRANEMATAAALDEPDLDLVIPPAQPLDVQRGEARERFEL